MIRSLKAFYLVTATGGCFVFFWGGSLLLSWIVLPLIQLFMARRSALERTQACQDVVGIGFRMFLGAMRWTHTLVFHPRRTRLTLPDRSCVVIANHPTLIDVAAIMAVQPRLCCVARSALFESVMVGRLLRYCGHINGGGEGVLDGLSVILQAIERLEQGQSVLIFPEGTRSTADGLRRFRPGAFEICRRAVVPAVPILISCDLPTLLKGVAWYALPKKTAHYVIRQLPTLDMDALSGDSHRNAQDVQRMFQSQISNATVSEASRNPLTEDVTHARP